MYRTKCTFQLACTESFWIDSTMKFSKNWSLMNIDETTEHIVNNSKQTEIEASCGKLSIHIHADFCLGK